MNGRSGPVLLVASALAFALHFLALPQIDLAVNGLFYQAGTGFLLRGNAFFDAVHEYLGLLAAALLAWAGAVFILARGGEEKWRARRPAALFLALAVLLGPGLVVNVLFKDQWGRARPAQVEAFGGQARFTPAWVVSDQCHKNCSFVCGDASLGYVLMAVAFVSRRPRFWLGLGFAAGSALGVMRMGQGGHFFSDVVFSFYAVYFTSLGLKHYLSRGGRRLAPLD